MNCESAPQALFPSRPVHPAWCSSMPRSNSDLQGSGHGLQLQAVVDRLLTEILQGRLRPAQRLIVAETEDRRELEAREHLALWRP